MHFGYIATRLMQGDLPENELIYTTEKMGYHNDGRIWKESTSYTILKKLIFLFDMQNDIVRK